MFLPQLIIDSSEVLTETSTSFSWASLGAYVLLGFVVIFFIVYGLIRLWRFFHRPDLHGLTREHVEDTWKQIGQTADQGIMGAKLSVIEADKLLDMVLKSMMMPGETLGERLKSASYKYPNIQKVWGAHRLRNQLVHDASFEISARQAKGALKDYWKALKILRIV